MSTEPTILSYSKTSNRSTKHGVVVSAACLILASACSATSDHNIHPKPTSTADLSRVRNISWTATAQHIAEDGSAQMSPIGDFDSYDSVASGSTLVTSAQTSGMLTVAGLSAKSGRIQWRRRLELSSQYGSQCVDDDGGPVVACRVDARDGSAALTVIDEKTGAVRSTAAMPKALTFTVRGDDLYTAEYDASTIDETGVLNAVIERRSLSTMKKRWRSEIRIPLENWGHDGGESIEVGANRIVASSGPIEVVVDKSSGEELSKPTLGTDGLPNTAFETPLLTGGWTRSRQGMPSESGVQINALYSPRGELLATETSDGTSTGEIDGSLVIVGNHLYSASTGQQVFTSLQGDDILASYGSGAYVYTARGDEPRVTVWNGNTGRRRGSFTVPGYVQGGDIVMNRQGAAALVLVESQRNDDMGPYVLNVVDPAGATISRSIPLPITREGVGAASMALTSAGAVITSQRVVLGFVAGR